MELRDAVLACRIHHQLLQDKFKFEAGFPWQFQRALSQVHVNIALAQQLDCAMVQAIHITKNEAIHAVSDPRTGGQPSGY